MKYTSLIVGSVFAFATAVVHADEPKVDDTNQPTQTHSDTTVTGTVPASADAPAAAPNADDTNQPPRTHIDTTVVGDAVVPGAAVPAAAPNLDNDHHFVAGEPALIRVTKQLQLSATQTAAVHEAIEKADAGAAVLIKREQNVQEMIAATTPEDPLYAKLINDQTGNADRWTENRDGLRQDVAKVLTPAQRSRFEKLQPRSRS